jgi:hypothetical protein
MLQVISVFEAPSLKSQARWLLVDTPLRHIASPLHRGFTRLESLYATPH